MFGSFYCTMLFDSKPNLCNFTTRQVVFNVVVRFKFTYSSGTYKKPLASFGLGLI